MGILRLETVNILMCLGFLVLASCSGDSPSALPSAPSPSPSVPPPPAPGDATRAFSIDLPVAATDVGTSGYGIWPFGVHGSSHAADGHPGFDIEFRPGTQVRAAAAGTVQHVVPDSQSPGRFTIRIDHSRGAAHYATDYTNVSDIAAGIAAGASVAQGQPLGMAGVQTQFIGTSQVTWAMTHFQVNDFSRSEGLTNQNAVSPAEFFGTGAQALFNAIWPNSAYRTEICEPFPANSRAAGFPMSRTWLLRSGSLPVRIDVRCVSENGNYEYVLRAADGSQIEAGAIVIDATVKPLPTVELRPTSGPARFGVYDIVSGTMELNLGAPGGSRPPSLTGASVYTSTP